MASGHRQKTATFRFDLETHEILDELSRDYGQNKTQILKRVIREEKGRKDLVKSATETQPPNHKGWDTK